MTTLFWWAVVALSRLRCRLGRHDETTRIRGEYVIHYCRRCFRADVELVGAGMP